MWIRMRIKWPVPIKIAFGQLDDITIPPPIYTEMSLSAYGAVWGQTPD